MRILTKRSLVEFVGKHPEAKATLFAWYKVVKGSTWNNFSDVRKTFQHADLYRDCVIFNIGGNKYRLIVKIRYRIKLVYIRYVLTHADYDKNAWKEDCEC